jgi:hypothetical protein
LGTVRGRVLDAVTGSEVTGSVFTTAICAGDGCASATGDAQGFVTPLEKGVFSFDAAPPAEGKLKPALLTLSPDTAFTITAKDYEPLVIAHGPRAKKKTDANGQSFTELPTLYLCPIGAKDNDGDDICDAAEARYTTNPNSKDEDQDALSDSLELLGHPAKDNTTIYDVRSLEADPHKRDIFVAVRYTESSQPPSQEAFTLVERAFAAAPSPDDVIPPGIHLHILSDERRLTGKDDVALLDDGFVKFRELTGRYYGPRPLAFHYALFGHQYHDSGAGDDTSSGMSNDIGAAEFIVTLGSFPNATDLQQAGTFMHELGHNLGLQHGGKDHELFKPAYLSIMNYNYQMHGIERASGTVLDYARITLAEIDETQVNEQRPFALGPSTKDEGQLKDYRNPRVLAYNRGEPFATVEGNLAGALDLNLNGKIEPDVCTRFDPINSRGPRVYQGKETRNDWATLNLGGGATGRVGDVPVPQNAVIRTVDDGPLPCLPANLANVLFGQLEPNPDGSGSPGSASDEPQSWPEYAPPAAPMCWVPGQEAAAAPTNTPETTPEDDSPTSQTDTTPTSPTETNRTSQTDTVPTDPSGPVGTDPTDDECECEGQGECECEEEEEEEE